MRARVLELARRAGTAWPPPMALALGVGGALPAISGPVDLAALVGRPLEMRRGRGFMSGGLWDGEYDSETTVELGDRVKALENAPGSTTTKNTLTGAPQPRTPYLVATRVGDDGLVYPTVGIFISSTTRKVWATHRKVRNNGTYGPDILEVFLASDDHRTAGQMELALSGKAPNHTFHCIALEAKLAEDEADDGGNRATNPPDDAQRPTTPAQGTELASFATGAAQPDRQTHNEALNTKLNWGQADWGDTSAGAGTHDNHRLARWRLGRGGGVGWDIDQSIPDQTVTTLNTYWSSAQHVHPPSGATIPAGCLVLQTSAINTDPCVKLHHDPFDADEPCEVQFSIFIPLVRGGAVPPTIEVTIEDGNAGTILAFGYVDLASLHVPSNQWTTVRATSMTIRSNYVQVPGAGQVARFHPTGSTGSGYALIDKVLVGHMAGAYSQNPRDKQVSAETPTVARTGAGRGAGGYGRTGGESPVGGQILRPSTE